MMKNAVIFGSNLASFCVERFGTERMQNLTKEEVDETPQNESVVFGLAKAGLTATIDLCASNHGKSKVIQVGLFL